jgi:SAM-dependent methyltransferase
MYNHIELKKVFMDSNLPIFDRQRYKLNRARALRHFYKYNFLYEEASESIRERLELFKQEFQDVLVYGEFCGNLPFAKSVIHADIIAKDESTLLLDEEDLTIANESFDLIISNLSLHFVNDILTTFKNYRDALRSGGFFLGMFLGANTLYELREAMKQVDIKLHDGLSSRMIPMIDVKDAGRLVQQAGYKMPISDIEVVQVQYETITELLRDVKGMGQGNCLQNQKNKYSGKDYFKMVEEEYKKLLPHEDGKLVANFELVTVMGKK